MMLDYKLVIFDWDGTLMDSIARIVTSMQAVAQLIKFPVPDPQQIKNIIGLSGYINEAIFKDDYTKNDFSKLNIYSSHGSVDQVIPVDWARKTKPFLQNLNINIEYSEFPVGHGVAPQNFYELIEWLLRHS